MRNFRLKDLDAIRAILRVYLLVIIFLLAIQIFSFTKTQSQNHPEFVLHTTLGYGTIQALDWHEDNIYIQTSSGVWIYDTATLDNANPNLTPYKETYSGNLLTTSFEEDSEQIVIEFEPGAVTVQTVSNRETSELSFLAHSDTIRAAAIYPHGNLLAVARTSLVPFQVPSGDDFDIRVWNTTGEELFVLHGHTAQIVSLTFSPNGQLLASSAYDGTVRLWNMVSGQQIIELQGRNPLAFSDNGQNLLFTNENRVFSYALASGSNEDNATQIAQANSVVSVVTLTSQHLAIGDNRGNIYLYNADFELLAQWNAHSQTLTAIQFDSQMSRIVSSTDMELKVWDLESNTLLSEINQNFTHPVQDMEWINDIAIATTERWAFRIWDVSSSSQLCSDENFFMSSEIEIGLDDVLWVSGYNNIQQVVGCSISTARTFFTGDEIRTIRVNKSGSKIAVARYGWIEIYNIEGQTQPLHIDAHDEPINAIEFSQNGDFLASGSGIVPFDVVPSTIDRTIRLWNSTTGDQIAEFLDIESPVFALAFRPDGKQLASGHASGVIQVWDVENQTQVSNIMMSSPITALTYSPNGRLLVWGQDNGTVILRDMEVEQNMLRLSQHHNTVTAIAFNRTGQYLAISSLDGTVSIWTVSD